MLPPSMRWQHEVADGPRGSEEFAFGDEEGESMVGFDIERRDRMVRGGNVEGMDSQRRLSRDLEEGFKDDSEEEQEGDGQGTAGRR